MKTFYTIATELHVTEGHGESDDYEVIMRTGSYGSGDFPPLFTSRLKAEAWLADREYRWISPSIVELHLHYERVEE